MIMHTIAMRLDLVESLTYLKTRKFEMARRTYYEHKKRLKEEYHKRALDIAKYGLLEQHMARITNLETIEHEQWLALNLTRTPNIRSQILERITSLQPFITAMYDATRKIMEKQVEMKKSIVKEDEVQLSS